jgi:hypothetical protein
MASLEVEPVTEAVDERRLRAEIAVRLPDIDAL